MSSPAPVAASAGDAPEPEFPVPIDASDAAVVGASVVVVDVGTVVVVDEVVEPEFEPELVLVVVEEDVVGVPDVVGVVEVVGSALDVTLQHELKVCGTPGAAALRPALFEAVEYSQSACTLSEAGEPMHEEGKLRPYWFVARLYDTVTPVELSHSTVKGDLALKTTPLNVPGVSRLLSASAT